MRFALIFSYSMLKLPSEVMSYYEDYFLKIDNSYDNLGFNGTLRYEPLVDLYSLAFEDCL